ncbi:MCE family protein [Nonomuraea typhae]|uniref:MCE family protein n=1 Tax=Nonomuraea typhae TaxID=2603600 RepID=UPI0012FBE3B8|nr:MCE family protein [Nonomuraea typhae]
MNRWLAALLATLAACAAFLLLQPGGTVRASVRFDRVVGLYPGSDVRILGVKVGEVTAVTPMGDQVRVDLAYDSAHKVPADAEAVIVARSVVADRFVQLAPPYTGGPILKQGATLAAGRVPVEIDEALASFNTLTRALGPEGANADGSLSRLLKVSADTFGGQGATVGAGVRSLSDAASALAANRDEFSRTIRNLAEITGAMTEDDARIRAFMRDLATVSGGLDDERDELRAVFKGLSRTLEQVAGFVEDNRGEITAGTRDLADITELLVRQRASIESFLQTAPLAVNNANNAYDPRSGTFRARLDLNAQTDDLAMWLCSLAAAMGTPPAQCEPLLKPLNPLGRALNHAGLDASGLLPEARVKRPDVSIGGLLPPPGGG